MNWYLQVLKKYTVFTGRAQRQEYWMFFLFNMIITIAIGFLEGFTGTLGMIGIIYSLAILLPGLAVSIRRLHDTNRSGWWLLIGLIPLLGTIVLLVFMALDSHPEENQYGPNPKLKSA